ncbi:restriction endonuclease subunit S [Lactobacillus delbrueckii subsp. allosunkii]|uniref:restriction endonuclease subunit S n=1 Tax=Lactobacillus delbrueckii TaxID=1584 RepID=UPI003A89B18B
MIFAWEQCKLGDVAKIVGGGTPSTKKSEYWNGNINWFTPAEIGNQIFVSHSQKKITELGLLKSSAKILPAGAILFTSRAGIGNTAILTRNACTNQGFQSIVPYSNKLDSYFIYSESAKLKRYGETMGSGSTFTEVSGKQMKKMSLHIPNINEQAKIGNMLKILDQTITLHEEKKRQLERLKSALLQKMFADKSGYPAIRFEGFSDEWEQCKVKDIFKITRGKVLAATETSEEKSDISPFPVYSSQTKNNGLMGYYKDYLFDTAITWTTDGANAGTVSYRSGRFYSTNVNGVLISDKGYANKAISEILNLEAWKWVSHVGNPKLMNNVMGDISIMIPSSFEEQDRLSDFLNQLDDTITLHNQKLNLLKLVKQSLLQNMFI